MDGSESLGNIFLYCGVNISDSYDAYLFCPRLFQVLSSLQPLDYVVVASLSGFSEVRIEKLVVFDIFQFGFLFGTDIQFSMDV